jgi:CP family cyanate transporter-like MFS transporter
MDSPSLAAESSPAPPMTDTRSAVRAPSLLIPLVLLWLGGAALRLTILAVPPVIPLIHDDLHLSQTQVGILTGLPSLLFAFAAVPGSLLIARTGAVAALVVGLTLNAIGGALRGAMNDVMWLYAMTVVMGIGVAIMQVTMPPTVRTWAPQRIGFATAVYTNGLLIGETLPVALMIPLTLPLVGTWQWGFVFWSVPVAIIAALVLLLAPRATATTAVRRRWWPDWNDSLIWRLGIMLGTINAMYFGTNAFLPGYLTYTGHPELISAALTALNVGQLPASFILLAVAQRLEMKSWPFVASGVLCLTAIAGIVFGSGIWIVLAAGLVGFAAAFILIMALALPPLLAAPDDVHRLTAAMFTISYAVAVVVPVLSGATWDMSGIPASAFMPIAVCAILLMVLAPAINRLRRWNG